jgi:transposase
MGKHQGYTPQFRRQAVKLVTEQGLEPTTAARELGMPFSTLLLWLKKAGWRRPDPQGAIVSQDPAVLQAQVKELRRQVKRLEMEKDILKKATAYFASQSTSGSPSSSDGEESSR